MTTRFTLLLAALLCLCLCAALPASAQSVTPLEAVASPLPGPMRQWMRHMQSASPALPLHGRAAMFAQLLQWSAENGFHIPQVISQYVEKGIESGLLPAPVFPNCECPAGCPCKGVPCLCGYLR